MQSICEAVPQNMAYMAHSQQRLTGLEVLMVVEEEEGDS